ncbi:hypothetical protein ACPCB7_25640, partial [Streptomyces arboris]|uniref:hypothetical protein n=1 Tax=Streptomyces arboris TaxID=2600619 RepID=UPI003C2D1452
MTVPSTLSLFPLPGINNPYSEVIRPLDLRQWWPGTALGRAVGCTVRPRAGVACVCLCGVSALAGVDLFGELGDDGEEVADDAVVDEV